MISYIIDSTLVYCLNFTELLMHVVNSFVACRQSAWTFFTDHQCYVQNADDP